MKTRVENIWEPQTRLFHWLLVLSLVLAFTVSEVFDLLPGLKPLFYDSWLGVHVAAGTAVGVLLAFRIYWGFCGGPYSRFSAFPWSIGELKRYLSGVLRGQKVRYTGHNPAASWVAAGVLATGVLAVATGVLLYGIEEGRGLFKGLYPLLYSYGPKVRLLHLGSSVALLLLVAVHLAGIVVETFRHGTELAASIVTGKKRVDEGAETGLHKIDYTKRFLSYVWLLAPLPLGVYIYWSVYSADPVKYGPPLDTYVSECGDCHNIFYPNLLPEKSWEAIMNGLEDHFGEDATIDEDARREILAYLKSHSAERSIDEAAFKMTAAIEDPENPPIRITENRYWKKKHAGIDPEVFNRPEVASKVNCSACHRWAEYGSFEDSDIRIPSSSN